MGWDRRGGGAPCIMSMVMGVCARDGVVMVEAFLKKLVRCIVVLRESWEDQSFRVLQKGEVRACSGFIWLESSFVVLWTR